MEFSLGMDENHKDFLDFKYKSCNWFQVELKKKLFVFKLIIPRGPKIQSIQEEGLIYFIFTSIVACTLIIFLQINIMCF